MDGDSYAASECEGIETEMDFSAIEAFVLKRNTFVCLTLIHKIN